MKKYLVTAFLIILNINAFALTVDSTVVPWTVGLRIRENPGTAGSIIGSLGLWERLTVLGVSNESEVINGNSGYWVRVRRENSEATGWVFSYFLEEINANAFFPVLEWRELSESGHRIINTFYNGGRRRTRLVLFWNNRPIESFAGISVSNNGRVMAFTWMDPETIVRDAQESTISGNRHLFVYNFTSHTLVHIDSAFVRYSDMRSERWADWNPELGIPSDLLIDNNLGPFALNRNGTRLFYKKDGVGIEVNIITGTRETHRFDADDVRYLGDHVLFTRFEPQWDTSSELYHPATRRTFTELSIFSSNPNSVRGSRIAVNLLRNRHLVLLENNRTMILHDLKTNEYRRITGDELQDVPPLQDYVPEEWHNTTLYFNHWLLYDVIFRVDDNDTIVALYRFILRDVPMHQMGSFRSTGSLIHNAGRVRFAFNANQAWMFISLHNNIFRQYRIDDGNASHNRGFFLMNND